MARPKSKRSVAIGTVPSPENLVKGGIIIDGKDVLLKVGRKKHPLTAGPLANAKELKALAKSDVAVLFSKEDPQQIVAIGTWPTPEKPRKRPRWIICYLPRPDLMKTVDPYIRKELLWAFEREGVIDPAVADMVRTGLARR